MNQKKSAKFLAAPRHALDLKFHKAVREKVNALLNAQIVDEKGNIIGTVKYADGNTVFQFKAAGGSTSIKGQWDPAVSYDKGVIVFFTPDGDYASTFYALQDVPAGVSPDTGAPYWASFPNSPAGLWA